MHRSSLDRAYEAKTLKTFTIYVQEALSRLEINAPEIIHENSEFNSKRIAIA